ncbi:hypothetical protein E1301_Tti021511 [Triplophysa tibetana]|uniref:Reverse transcriptase domain-containing protein n=1 Tax=Triplophysa tibetana TaxID=1572043 RepID=A0A5A9MZL3_9TELE|nr:hypothetical protein E1301_Tti021511 [Triplophysa tibetana]
MVERSFVAVSIEDVLLVSLCLEDGKPPSHAGATSPARRRELRHRCHPTSTQGRGSTGRRSTKALTVAALCTSVSPEPPLRAATGGRPSSTLPKLSGTASRKDAATAVLNGSWREAAHGPPRKLPGLAEFWAKVMGEKGPPAKINAKSTGEQHWALLDPIGVEELRKSLKSLTKSAVGMDKVTANNLLAWHLPSLASLMNLILPTENLPTPLATARITQQSPGDCTFGISDFRPIAITPILTRALHKVLARRMRDQLVFSTTQFAFLQRDGCHLRGHQGHRTLPWSLTILTPSSMRMT